MKPYLAHALLLIGATACSGPPRAGTAYDPVPLPVPLLTVQQSGTTALLQAVSPVNDSVVWVSGHAGTFARTLDGGVSWQPGRVAGADTLQFRDVHAVSADIAYLMSSGSGELSRIFKTTDGGRSWTQQYMNREPDAFFDCLAFWDANRGVVFSDAVRGEHIVLTTMNGGARWDRVPPDRLPAAAAGEGSFAASGSCVATHGAATAWIGTGNSAVSRVLKTTDAGQSWTWAGVPVASGEGAGLASVVFRDASNGVALGGEMGKPTARGDYVGLTSDGGRTWTVGGRPTFAGAVYGAAYVPGIPRPPLMAVGPGGADISRDDGRTWNRLDTLAYWSVGFASPRAGWAVGPRGRITRVRLH